MNITKRTTCRLCNSSNLELACPIKPTPVAEKYASTAAEAKEVPIVGLDLHRCADCGHVQVVDIVDGSYLFDADYTYRSGQTKGIIEHFQDYADTAWNNWGVAADDLVVEIGSNDGTLLKEFEQRGAKVLGIDPASTIAAEANERGIETWAEFFTFKLAEKIRDERGPAKLVAANNVFAHADDLQGIAAGVSHLLSDDGVFMFEVSYLLDVLEKCLLGTIFHEHMSYHAVKPLTGFLKRAGMEVVDVKRVGIQGGSLIVSAKKAGGPHAVRDSIPEILQLEESTQLNTRKKLDDFAKLLDNLCTETRALFDKAEQAGQVIGGFGAARSGTTLMAQLEIGDKIAYIFDDHPDKGGKFSAGFGIEVFPTSEIANKKPDYLLILAWIHAQKIMENNQGYLQQGGKWVTCVPNLVVTES